MEIKYTKELHKDFEKLNRMLDDAYYERFGEIALKYRPYNTLEGIEDFFITYDEEKPVACGCFRKITDKTVELKRVYVLPDYRRRGIANALVGNCEAIAREQSFKYMRLETGVEMLEAIQMYKKRKFVFIENYEGFAGDEICCCMQKEL